ncbi:ATP-grasp domain-containing protein [Salipaludibacillus sp. LMS25]|jgi:biotin carboxylase|uniref:ATP-grasp domain-containing protein n=1 Tax=Salipaludibacillus sp. LMS25 TaxID=2924031 RepID=UPI0020D16E61|nr:ATP-grasp domain-containing protein [Salipaludibacillus sp. LMS25]UTR13427.1 ATP-grasp domain-containing protein [Salipaludibacillus sp. LMS25]
MNTTKTILYINLRSHPVERVEPLKQARSIGLRVALLSDKEPNIDLTLIDDLIVTNTFDKQTATETVLKYNHKHKISGVLTWSDKDVELVAYLANELGVPGTSLDSARNARSKYLMREAWNSDPELSPRYKKVTTINELYDAADVLSYPLIFKPVGASGSKSIIKIDSKKELEPAYEQMIRNTNPERDKIYSYFPFEYILEEYLDGPEVTVDGLVQNGEIYIVGVIDKHITLEHSLEYFAIFPSNKPQEVVSEIEAKAEQAVKLLGLDNTAFHLECRVTKNGVRIIECAARPGGGYIASHLITMATGYSFQEQVIRMAIGEKVNFANLRNYKQHAGMIILLPEQKGSIEQIDGLIQALEVNNIQQFIQTKQIGDYVNIPPEDFASYYGVFIGKADNAKELEKSLFKASQTIKFTVREEK